MPKVSVIVPVYNAENYLHRCVDSILTQTFTDFELLLINDGSKDSSGKICDEYAANDSRVQVFHKENEGVSSARNLGLDNANGEWISFIDSDDWISENYLNIMNSPIRSDLVVGAIFFKRSENISYLSDDSAFYDEEKFVELILKEITNPLLNSPCAKFLRKSIIEHHNLRFDELLCFGEDAVFVKEYILHINNVQVENSVIYDYDDIGDDIYKKYSNSFMPIYNYYLKMSSVYTTLENKYNILLSKKELIGVVYNISTICLKRDGLKEWNVIRNFFMDSEARNILKDRRSLYVKHILLLSYDCWGIIFIAYFNLIERVKSIFKS